jgi:hypothetical protein
MQVVYNVFAITPYTIINAVMLDPNIGKDPTENVIISSARIISILFLYSCFAVSFNKVIDAILSSLILYLESILYLSLCVRTFSSSINLCTI